jgi:exodeoxyribonuclease-3
VKIATWNINSVRLRASSCRALFARTFPRRAVPAGNQGAPTICFRPSTFKKLGYVHQAIHGQKAYHGVAILSRLPFKKTRWRISAAKAMPPHQCNLRERRGAARFLCPGGRRHSRSRALNPKFAHKLDFLAQHGAFLRQAPRRRESAPVVLVGDLNVAPLENDVWSHKQLLDVVSHTPVETKLLGEVKAAFDWCDVTRNSFRHTDKIYSWWSYRAADWEARTAAAASTISGSARG